VSADCRHRAVFGGLARMFELIKVVIEQVFRMIDFNGILRARKASRLSDIGLDLLGLYVSMNKIYVTGEDILNILDIARLRNYFEQWQAQGTPQERVGVDLKRRIAKQRENIMAFGSSFSTLYGTVAIVDPKTTREIELVMRGKEKSIFYYVIAEMAPPEETPSYMFSATRERELIERFFGPGQNLRLSS
jgi:hypothetical protein